MDAGIAQQLKKKLHIKWRVLREKPRFVLGYVMDSLFTWFLGLIVALIGMALFPALSASGPTSGFKLAEMVNVDKAGQIVSNITEKICQFSLTGCYNFVTEVLPAEIKRLFIGLCELVKKWRELLGELVGLLLSPQKIWERLQSFWERYHVKIKAVATQALGVAISFVLLKLLLFIVPRIRTGILTIWGVNASFFILQWCIALISPPLARKLRTKLGEIWTTKKKRELHAAGGTFIANVREAMDTNRQKTEEGGSGTRMEPCNPNPPQNAHNPIDQ